VTEMTSKRRGLGRGLGALIPGVGGRTVDPPIDGAHMQVPVAAIAVNPLQPRKHFEDAQIDELAESIRQRGILQPLLVRRVADGFQLIAGERRLRAAQRVGLSEVPVSVQEADDRDALEMALIENIQREDLNPIEEARAYRQLADEFGLTQEAVAARVGKDRSTVANTLRLLALPDSVQRDIERRLLSAGHARALVNVGAEALQLELAREVVARRLTVRQTEQMAKVRSASAPDADHRAAEHRLTEALGTRVRIVFRKNAAGRIEIEYDSLAALNHLIDRLCSA
jgi:ParB family chromosome partitioning protein